MIKVIGIEKSFNSQKVLNGVDLTIHDKELMAVVGKSGSGKSVFLKHLLGLLKPDRGSIIIDDVDITKLRGKELDRIRERLGVVFQGGALFDSLTVYENVAFPLTERTRLTKEEINDRVMQTLDDVGLWGIGEKYPAEISGGMKKRVALARALISEPKIIFFDEPATGLDPVILNSIHRFIVSTHEKYGFTGVIISHDIPEIFDVADRVAMLHNGIIAEVGTSDEIKNSLNPIVKQFIIGIEAPSFKP